MDFKRYIFLDIDGVLNHPKFYEQIHDDIKSGKINKDDWKNQDILFQNVDIKKLHLINQLTGCEIVMITSWDHDRCQQILPKMGLKLPIIGGIDTIELEKQWMVRGNGIAKWFFDHFDDIPRDSFFNSFKDDGWWHPGRIYKIKGGKLSLEKESKLAITYVILDDSADMLMDQKNHFIHINECTGLTQENIDCAKRILHL